MNREIERLYEYDEPVRDLAPAVTIPDWIDPEIRATTVAAICHGGCESGAYMPAVTYHQALETMRVHGDAVLDYLEESGGELTLPDEVAWSTLAIHWLSRAVEAWAAGALTAIADAIDEREEDNQP